MPSTGPVYKSAPQMFTNMNHEKMLRDFKYGKGLSRFSLWKDSSGVILGDHLQQEKFGIIVTNVWKL